MSTKDKTVREFNVRITICIAATTIHTVICAILQYSWKVVKKLRSWCKLNLKIGKMNFNWYHRREVTDLWSRLRISRRVHSFKRAHKRRGAHVCAYMCAYVLAYNERENEERKEEHAEAYVCIYVEESITGCEREAGPCERDVNWNTCNCFRRRMRVWLVTYYRVLRNKNNIGMYKTYIRAYKMTRRKTLNRVKVCWNVLSKCLSLFEE